VRHKHRDGGGGGGNGEHNLWRDSRDLANDRLMSVIHYSSMQSFQKTLCHLRFTVCVCVCLCVCVSVQCEEVTLVFLHNLIPINECLVGVREVQRRLLRALPPATVSPPTERPY